MPCCRKHFHEEATEEATEDASEESGDEENISDEESSKDGGQWVLGGIKWPPDAKESEEWPLATSLASRCLMFSSCLGGICAVLALYMFDQWFLSFLAFLCTFCSLNYWRKAELGCRRDLDFTVAGIVFVISVWLSFDCAFQRLYLAVLGVSVVLFTLAVTLWTLRCKWWFVVHMVFHCTTFTANIILYAGRHQIQLQKHEL
jgi:hypothetical protein